MRIFQYLGSDTIFVKDGEGFIEVNPGDEVMANETLARGLEHRSDFVEVHPAPPEMPAVVGRVDSPVVQSTPTA